MSPEDFERRLQVEISGAIERHPEPGNVVRTVAADLLRRLVDAEERAAQSPATIAPYVHGDPRVDRWQVVGSGTYPPPDAAPPEGFEPLAAWSPFCAVAVGFSWERPLRACEVAR